MLFLRPSGTKWADSCVFTVSKDLDLLIRRSEASKFWVFWESSFIKLMAWVSWLSLSLDHVRAIFLPKKLSTLSKLIVERSMESSSKKRREKITPNNRMKCGLAKMSKRTSSLIPSTFLYARSTRLTLSGTRLTGPSDRLNTKMTQLL